MNALAEEVETDPRAQVERPAKTVTFVARCHNLILSIFPELRENHMGMTRAASPGYRLQFMGGTFAITTEVRRDFEKFLAKYGRFYAYDDRDFEEIKARSIEDYVRAKASFQSSNPDGFWEMHEVVPEPTAELLAILDAFTSQDEGRVEEILENEVAGFNRPKVIEAGNKALERLYLDGARSELERDATERAAEAARPDAAAMIQSAGKVNEDPPEHHPV